MKISALEEYGLRCMVALAKGWPDKSLSMPELSSMEGLSIPYIGKLMMILKQAGLVKALRGRNGGYMLADSPENINLKVIFMALGEPIYSSRHCLRYPGDKDSCVHEADCNIKTMWLTFSNFINGILKKLTLADMVKGDYAALIDSSNGNSKFAGGITREYEPEVQAETSN